MPRQTKTCIYCGASIARKGAGDHVIPAALGDFEGYLHFDEICNGCNVAIGRCEQQMLNCGPERVFRDIVVPATSRSGGERSAWIGGPEAPPPRIMAQLDEGPLLAKPMGDARTIELHDQLVFKDNDGKERVIRLDPRMSAKALKLRVNELGIKGFKDKGVRLHCSEANTKHYLEIMRAFSPNARYEEGPPLERGMHPVLSVIELRVTNLYFRALAKIAFHYYLTQSCRARGGEDAFSAMRAFIRHGQGRMEDFFTKEGPFSDPWPKNMAPAKWSHLLAASDKGGDVVGYVRLFRGPESGSASQEYTIRLGRVPTSRLLFKRVWAHIYDYNDPVPSEGIAGIVSPVPLGRRPVFPV